MQISDLHSIKITTLIIISSRTITRLITNNSITHNNSITKRVFNSSFSRKWVNLTAPEVVDPSDSHYFRYNETFVYLQLYLLTFLFLKDIL